MSTEFHFYYRVTDLFQTQNVQNTFLYSDSCFTTPSGLAVYNVVLINEKDLVQVDIEDSTFFLGENKTDCIFFKIALIGQSVDNKLLHGNYLFGVTGGSGKYLNAKGTVFFHVDSHLVRHIKVSIHSHHDENC